MLFKAFFNNTGTPKSFLGKLMLKAMNSGHASVADWGLSYISALSAKDIQSVADIGCGGGRNVARLFCAHADPKRHWLCLVAKK